MRHGAPLARNLKCNRHRMDELHVGDHARSESRHPLARSTKRFESDHFTAVEAFGGEVSGQALYRTPIAHQNDRPHPQRKLRTQPLERRCMETNAKRVFHRPAKTARRKREGRRRGKNPELIRSESLGNRATSPVPERITGQQNRDLPTGEPLQDRQPIGKGDRPFDPFLPCVW